MALAPVLDAALAQVWKHRHRTPAELLALTPAQLALTLGVRLGPDCGRRDPVAELTVANDHRAQRGLLPVCPSWLLRSLPRSRR